MGNHDCYLQHTTETKVLTDSTTKIVIGDNFSQNNYVFSYLVYWAFKVLSIQKLFFSVFFFHFFMNYIPSLLVLMDYQLFMGVWEAVKSV